MQIQKHYKLVRAINCVNLPRAVRVTCHLLSSSSLKCKHPSSHSFLPFSLTNILSFVSQFSSSSRSPLILTPKTNINPNFQIPLRDHRCAFPQVPLHLPFLSLRLNFFSLPFFLFFFFSFFLSHFLGLKIEIDCS